MNMVYLVLPLALLLAGVAVAAFLWAARRGQFDDLDTPARRMLHDDLPVGRRAGDGDLGADAGAGATAGATAEREVAR